MQNLIIFLKFQLVELIIPISAISCQTQLVIQIMEINICLPFYRQTSMGKAGYRVMHVYAAVISKIRLPTSLWETQPSQ